MKTLIKLNKTMRRISFIPILLLCMAFGRAGFAQNEFSLDKVTTIKSPDVTSFESLDFIPLNEYTGRIEVEIPIFEIEMDGVSVPISISYNTGGVRVNSTSSRVGLNWNLNAGGVISREIKGDDDFLAESAFSDGCLVYTRSGYINRIIYNTPLASTQPSTRDRQPDIFIVTAPDFSTQFTHKTDGSPLELVPTSSLIENYFNDPNKRFETIKITSANGLEYTFDEKEISANMFSNYNINEGPHENIPLASWDENTNINDAITIINLWPKNEKNINNYSANYLSKIKKPVSNDSITFEYDENYILDYNRRIERNYDMSGNFHSQTDYVHDYTLEKVLKKINFPQGTIDFIYENERLDLVGAKKLIRIDIKDINGSIIKKTHFVQDYFESSESCFDPQCLRLKLKEVYFESENGTLLPGYKFNYNTTNLPKRFSYKQDFLGYANGVNVSSTYQYKPILYKKENQGKDSFIPFNISGQGYSALPGNFSLESNESFAQGATLEKITYPTGGYSLLEYELNCFRYLNNNICGGGLRIASNKIYDTNSNLERQVNYTYLESDNTSSGNILFIPKYIKSNPGTVTNISQTTVSPYELTNNSYVGYSRVKIEEVGKGYIINEYSSPKDEPNIYPVIPSLINTNEFTNMSVFDYAYANGITPSLFQNLEVKRGVLKSSKTFDFNSTLIKETTNEYAYKLFQSLGVGEAYGFHSIDYLCDLYYEPYALFSTQLNSERYLLTKATETNYFTTGTLVNETSYSYDSDRPFIKEKRTLINDVDELIERTYYPYDTEVNSLLYMNDLVTQNRVSSPIKTEVLKNLKLLQTNLLEYDIYDGDKILPSLQKSSKSTNAVEEKLSFDLYDERGNILQTTTQGGVSTAYIWGYNKTRLIAKIENATYSQVSSFVINIQSKSDIDNDRTIDIRNSLGVITSYIGNEGDLRNVLNNLRNIPSLTNSQVTTYTYDPLIGVTSITDANGRSTYFNYDDFNRLESVMDLNGQILKQYQYNLKMTPDGPVSNCDEYKLTVSGTHDDDFFSFSYTNCNGNITTVNDYVGSVGFGYVYTICVKKNTGGVSTSGYISENSTGNSCD